MTIIKLAKIVQLTYIILLIAMAIVVIFKYSTLLK